MQASDLKVTVYKSTGDSNVLARVSVVILDAIAIKGIKIVKGPNGPFVSMPSKPKKTKDGELAKDENGKTIYTDIAHPISAEARQVLVDAIMAAYNEA